MCECGRTFTLIIRDGNAWEVCADSAEILVSTGQWSYLT